MSATGGGKKKTSPRKSRAKEVRENWQPPDRPPPDSLLIEAYLSDARAQIADTDIDGQRRQLEARRALPTLYRAQLLERDRLAARANEVARAHDPNNFANWQSEQKLMQQADKAVDPRLKFFFATLSDQVWRSEDPVTALQILLSVKAGRGAPRKYEYRDFLIATEVAGRMYRREKRDAAVKAVADQFRLGCDAVLNIYKRRNKREVKAQLGLFGLPGEAGIGGLRNSDSV